MVKDRLELLSCWFGDDDGERMRLSVVSFLSRAFLMISSRRRSVKGGGGSGEYMPLFVIDLLHGVRVGSRGWKGEILGCRRCLLLLLLLQNAKKVAIYNFEIMSHGFDQW